MSRGKELAKNTALITIGKISTQVVSFLLLPLYTTLLSTEQYGIVDLILNAVQIILPIMTLMIEQGAFRYLLSCDNEDDRQRVISTSVLILLLLNIIWIAINLILFPFINILYQFWIVILVMVTGIVGLFLQFARGLKKVTLYSFGSFMCATLIILFNILFVLALDMKVEGMLIATFLGNTVTAIFLFFSLKLYRWVSIKKVTKLIMLDELKYSIPLVPNQLSVLIMNSSDRFIVTSLLDVAANGILAVSHKFPAAYMSIFSMFLLAWQETGTIHYNDKDRDVFFSSMFSKVFRVFASISLVIILILPFVFDILVKESFSDAYSNIPIYMMAFLSNVVIGFLGVVYVAEKKTLEIAKTTILSAVINIVLHILLIKHLGLYAASISTFVSYFITMIYRLIDTKRYIKITYDLKKCGILILANVFSIYIYYVNNRLMSIILLPVFILILIFVNSDLISSIRCNSK